MEGELTEYVYGTMMRNPYERVKSHYMFHHSSKCKNKTQK